MNLVRIVSWALLLGATIVAGPNLPAQMLMALRELVAGCQRLLFFPRRQMKPTR